MKATIVESVMGAFGFSEDNTLVEKVFFPKDAVETAERLKKIEDGTLIEEISGLIDSLKKKGYTQFVFENQQTATAANQKMKIEVSVEQSSGAGSFFRENWPKLLWSQVLLKNQSSLGRTCTKLVSNLPK